MKNKIATLVVLTLCAIGNSQAESLTDKLIQLGASKARDCLKLANSGGPYKADHLHAYADCVVSAVTPIQYSSGDEKLIDAGVYIGGKYILAREFGPIDQKTYGTLGVDQKNQIDSGYRWALAHLKESGVGKDAACAAIGWTDCKSLP
ncbi:hypothetical protein GCM10011611_38890 [Aliidongia dinghuensis]|uniref:Uncharacterized protein n=1 Tax=Aliidongia dinghuensis TaxID=1867774 RepID=A0A8J2YWS4_9PROT|nr:hypothetical protein [Aliidongia dinghuensis]GGF29031.1 hypothetical protein GCM10011611_38890 [Aliidongia dinghuensis]